MTQLPFVPPTSSAPAAYGAPYYDQRQQIYYHAARAGPQAGEVAVPAGSAPFGGGAAGIAGSLQQAPAYALQQPGATGQAYASGGPVPLVPSSSAHPPGPTAAAPPAHDALAAHHRSLVAYYWLYAQQGFAAPLTALEGSVERAQQERARTEAVEWARTCGIVVVDPAAPAPAPALPHYAQPMPSEPVRARTMSRPLPSAPAGSAGGPARTGSGRPLPSPAAPAASSAAPPVAGPAAPSLARAPLPAAPAPPARRSTLPDPPSPLPSPSSSSPAVNTPSSATTSSQKRPLPLPPLAQLAAELDSVSFSGSAPQDEAAGATSSVPTIALPDEAPAPTASQSSIPTFSFAGGDDEDDEDPPATAPAVPTFSFGGPDDDAPPSAPAPPPQRRAAPLHPRHDPSHPSHKLYHPTSVLPSSSSSSSSPLPSSSSPAATSTSPALPEAGTLTCTACALLIFGRVLVALGREWHPDCFRCAEDGCGARLEVMEFEGTPEDWEGGEGEEEQGEGEGEKTGEDLRGKAWCMVHFEERFALECHQCRTPIASADYLPLSDPLLPPRASYRHPSTRFYHPLHFFCAGCGDPFVDPVSYELQGAAELEACPYVARDGHPYCDRCDLRMWRPKCAGCRKGLREEDGFLEVEGDKWHEGCFQCSMCAKPLNGIYLLRRDAPAPSSSFAAEPAADSDDDDVDELTFCAECYDIKAKEEAEAALGATR